LVKGSFGQVELGDGEIHSVLELDDVGGPRETFGFGDHLVFLLWPAFDVTGHPGAETPHLTFSANAIAIGGHLVDLLLRADHGCDLAAALGREGDVAHLMALM